MELPPKHHPMQSQWKDLFTPDLKNAIYPEGIWTFENGVFTASKDEVIWTRMNIHRLFWIRI
jgi:hypothetical protein